MIEDKILEELNHQKDYCRQLEQEIDRLSVQKRQLVQVLEQNTCSCKCSGLCQVVLGLIGEINPDDDEGLLKIARCLKVHVKVMKHRANLGVSEISRYYSKILVAGIPQLSNAHGLDVLPQRLVYQLQLISIARMSIELVSQEEFVLIELQGRIEGEYQAVLPLGRLFEENGVSRELRQVYKLAIGIHELQGQQVPLEQNLLMVEKVQGKLLVKGKVTKRVVFTKKTIAVRGKDIASAAESKMEQLERAQ